MDSGAEKTYALVKPQQTFRILATWKSHHPADFEERKTTKKNKTTTKNPRYIRQRNDDGGRRKWRKKKKKSPKQTKLADPWH